MKALHLKLIPPYRGEAADCLRAVLCLPGVGRLLLHQMLSDTAGPASAQTLYAPSDWLDQMDCDGIGVQGIDAAAGTLCLPEGREQGLLIVNARLNCHYRRDKLNAMLDSVPKAAVTVDITPELAAPNEVVRRGSNHRVVGFRRILEDIAEPASSVEDWPAMLYLPPEVCNKLASGDPLPLNIEPLRRRLKQHDIPLLHYRLGGQQCDVTSIEGVLSLMDKLPERKLNRQAADAKIDPTARMFGPVWVGRGARIEQDAVVIGPAIVGDGACIGRGTLFRHGIVAAAGVVPAGQHIQNALLLSDRTTLQAKVSPLSVTLKTKGRCAYRDWPWLSYPRLGKRLFDTVFSVAILLLISPIFLIVAVMLKLTSPGPVFYIARRQGRHGKEFGCLKFRTMMVQADALQERLRVVNQVDGPQFKIDNDPRITGFGKFLRDTCIDELPQFINVLVGQMSVVGPRPSPESENESCPAWRDARLSVRPGITGLWQVCRTRQAGMDFQEWVYYDTKYVRNLSFRQDLSICLKTAHKLINTFLDQFG